jgi:hypothetical protein
MQKRSSSNNARTPVRVWAFRDPVRVAMEYARQQLSSQSLGSAF